MPDRHVVIVQPRYLPLIAAGQKTIEARLLRSARAPLGCVHAGDLLYFKPVGGRAALRAVVRLVREWSDLRPAGVAALRRRYGASVAADADFWRARAGARYAVFVWFDAVRPVPRGPRVGRQYGNGWIVLK